MSQNSINSELVMLNGNQIGNQQGYQHLSSCPSNTYRESLMESTSTEVVDVFQEDDPMTPTGSPNTPFSASNMETTLELHPNVILGMTEDETSVSPNGGECDRPFLCPICQASYKTKTHLRRHMNVHMTSRPFPCSECGKGFNRKEHLNKHMEAVHSGNKHSCPYCDKSISRLDHLRRHIKNMHTNNLNAVKTIDSRDKAAILKLEIRSKRHKAQLSFRTPTSSFQTGTVGQTIITPIPLFSTTPTESKKATTRDNSMNECGNHSNSKPTTTMTIIPSNILGPDEAVATLAVQSTATQKVLVHQRLQRGSNIDLTTATNNMSSLTDLSLSLGEHFSLVVNERESKESSNSVKSERFKCGECTAIFSSDKELVAHKRTHKPSPFRCPDCGRCYTRREKLTEHIRCVHQGQKFSCEFCGKELSRKDHVLRHIRSVHPEVYAATFAEIDESQINIDEHGRLVSISRSYNVLKKKRNPKSSSFNLSSLGDVGVLLRSVCHVCLKVFGTAYHLTRHIESCHSGDARPFSCTACNKMFKRKDHLTKHIKSHCPTLKQEQTSNPNNIMDQTHANNNVPVLVSNNPLGNSSEEPDADQECDIGMLSEGSGSSSDCQHTILQNLQVEMDLSAHEDNSNICSRTTVGENSVGGVLIGGSGILKHSTPSSGAVSTSTGEYNLPVIDTYMQGGVNVVVVDEEISNFLLQSSSAHLTTTFPCAQCQKEFPQRDQLIAHALQEHSTEAVHHSHISDISFPDF